MPRGTYERTEIHNQRNSEAKKGSIPWNKGETGLQKAWNKNISGIFNHSDETKQKISDWHKGKHILQNISAGNKGRYKRWKINKSSGIIKNIMR